MYRINLISAKFGVRRNENPYFRVNYIIEICRVTWISSEFKQVFKLFRNVYHTLGNIPRVQCPMGYIPIIYFFIGLFPQ